MTGFAIFTNQNKHIMKKTILFTVLLLFLGLSLLAQNEDENTLIEEEIEAGDLLSAIQNTEKQISADSLNARLWYQLAKLQQQVLRYKQAINSFSKACELEPSNLTFLFAKAKTSYLAGKTTAAAKDYKRVLEKDSIHVGALLSLASFYNRKEDYHGAFNLYEKLHFIDTLNSEYLRKMAVCKMKLKEVNPAFNYLKKAYSIDSANIKVVDILSKVYTNMREYDTALLIIDKAISIYPNEGELYALRGYTHFKRNHHYRSIPDYEKALQLGIFNSAAAMANLGASLYVVERYEKARDVLEKLLFPDTLDAKVCIYLGNIYNQLGNPDKGIVFFKKSLELQEPDELSMSSTYRGLQACYSNKGLYYKEIEMIKMRQEVLGSRYRSPMYLWEIADIYETKIKNKQTALKYYEKLYAQIKDWYSEEGKNKLEVKINRLKEDIHFEK